MARDGHAVAVDDVDKAGESWTHGDVDDGQDVFLRRTGDDKTRVFHVAQVLAGDV